VNEGKSGFEAEWVRALGALGSLGSKKKLAAETKREMHFFSNEEKSNGLRIVWRERLRWQESELKMQRQRLSRSKKI